MSLRVLIVHPDFIMEDGMEAYVLEAGNLLDLAKIATIAIAQRENGASGAEHFLPEVGEGASGCCGVDLDHSRILGARWRLRLQGRTSRHEGYEESRKTGNSAGSAHHAISVE